MASVFSREFNAVIVNIDASILDRDDQRFALDFLL